MAKVIFEKRILDFLDFLSGEGPVFAPVIKKSHSATGKVSFSRYQKGDELELSYPVTVLPPKELLLPHKDLLFSFSGDTIQKPLVQKNILFGVSLEDLEGINHLKKIFSEPIADQVFLDKANQFSVICVDHFSPPKDAEFDLYLQRISSEHYVAYAKTAQGKKWLKSPYFADQSTKAPKVIKKKDHLIWDPQMAKIIANSKDHKIWDELAEICFGCGICSYVCPLCYCYETEDEIDFPIKKDIAGKRCRNWDSCMLVHFADTAPHNFRKELRDRIYNWYFHKFVRMPAEYGFPGCVECNRCVVYCPAKINYREVLESLKKDAPKNKGKK